MPGAEQRDVRAIHGRPEGPSCRWKPRAIYIGSSSPWEAYPEVGWQTAQMGPQGEDSPSYSASLAPRLSPAGPIRLRLPSHQRAPSSPFTQGTPPLQPFGIPPPQPPPLRLHSTHNLDCGREKRDGKTWRGYGGGRLGWLGQDSRCRMLPFPPTGSPLAR